MAIYANEISLTTGTRTHSLLIRNTTAWVRCSHPLGHDTPVFFSLIKQAFMCSVNAPNIRFFRVHYITLQYFDVMSGSLVCYTSTLQQSGYTNWSSYIMTLHESFRKALDNGFWNDCLLFIQIKYIYTHMTQLPYWLKTLQKKFSRDHDLPYSFKLVFKQLHIKQWE